MRITVDYEGNRHRLEASETDTHVVASTGHDGQLNLQPTATPAETMAHVQQAGDEDCRVAMIDAGSANFTVVPDYEAAEEPVAQADRRARTQEKVLLAVALVVIVVVVVLLV